MRSDRITRENYERRPYPAVKPGKRFKPIWRVAPLPWMQAMLQPYLDSPSRILVAGCGTGNEAFAFQREFPNAEIVGIDFSRRSIALAGRIQRRYFAKSALKFRWADLTSRGLNKLVGNDYDLVSCHGVLSYLERPQLAIAALEKCLAPNGALYLGVNGEAHFSERWRPLLPDFGFEPRLFEDGPEVRRTLTMFDALAGQPLGYIARTGAEYLASDLFGPTIQNWPLSRWTRLAAESGLFLRGSYSSQRTLRPLINHDLYPQLLPRNRVQAHELAEQILPTGFHLLLFAREQESPGPWADPATLPRYAIALTKLFKVRWPKSKRFRAGRQTVELTSNSTNTVAELAFSPSFIELIRRSNSVDTISAILKSMGVTIPRQQLIRHLYLLYLIGAINLRLPKQR